MKEGISTALTRSRKRAETNGTIRNARVEDPYCWVTAVMLAMAVGVEPKVMPLKPAQITPAS